MLLRTSLLLLFSLLAVTAANAGLTFAVVEPFQVILLVCAPCLFDEETRLGRCMGRCRFVYNELCAP